MSARVPGEGPILFFDVVPRPLRDLAYRVVARNRYRWFGRRETCRVPAAGEAERLLD